MSYIHMLPLPKNTLKHLWTWKSRHYFVVCLFMGHFRTSSHKTFSLQQGTSTFLMFASPRVYRVKSLVRKRRDLESFMAALSVQGKPGTIWVCMSPFITAIRIISSKSSFSGFRGSLVLCQWWDLVCTMEREHADCVLCCFGAPALLSLADVLRDLHVPLGWCVRARCHSWSTQLHCFASVRLFLVLLSGESWTHDHSGFGSQTGECL